MHDTTSSRLTINNLWRQGSSDNLRSGSTSIFRRLIAASDQRRASLVHFFPFHSSKRSSSWASIPRSLFSRPRQFFFDRRQKKRFDSFEFSIPRSSQELKVQRRTKETRANGKERENLYADFEGSERFQL